MEEFVNAASEDEQPSASEGTVFVPKMRTVHADWDEFDAYLEAYERDTGQQYRVRSSSSMASFLKNLEQKGLGSRGSYRPRTSPSLFPFYTKRLQCIHGWDRPSRGSGQRKRRRHVLENGCQAHILVTVMYDDEKATHVVRVTRQYNYHTHPLLNGIKFMPSAPDTNPPPPSQSIAYVNSSTDEWDGGDALSSLSLPALSRSPAFPFVFYYKLMKFQTDIQLPLVAQKGNANEACTSVSDLELLLRKEFHLPCGSSVFAVLPAGELYSPMLPLVMLNAIAAQHQALHESVVDALPSLHFVLIARSMSSLLRPLPRQGGLCSPFDSIPMSTLALGQDCIERRLARKEFSERLVQYGFAQVEVTNVEVNAVMKGYELAASWLTEQIALSSRKRWKEEIEVMPVDRQQRRSRGYQSDEMELLEGFANEALPTHSKRYVGFSADRLKECLQLRPSVNQNGSGWPPKGLLDQPELATRMQELIHRFDQIARECLEAICDELNLNAHWMLHTLLDTTSMSNDPNVVELSNAVPARYGASILQVLKFKNRPRDVAVGDTSDVQADEGLLKVFPTPTHAGLHVWNVDRMNWTDVEQGIRKTTMTVVAGETLGFITNGHIRAPLYRVASRDAAAGDDRRMSMPFSLRVKPEQVLNPHEAPYAQKTCREFMEECVLQRRPWRPIKRNSNATEDF